MKYTALKDILFDGLGRRVWEPRFPREKKIENKSSVVSECK